MPRPLFEEHELRRTVVKEMHLRCWPSIAPPSYIIQLLRVGDPADPSLDQALTLPRNAVCDQTHDRHLSGVFAGNVSFTCETHSEATTTTLFASVDASEISARLDQLPQLQDALVWACAMPGKVIRATRILICEDEPQAEALISQTSFNQHELVSCHIGTTATNTGARIWSDFHIRDDGFGMVVIAANDLLPSELARVTQRLQELGNYRNLALLGLPIAREGWIVLDAIERDLSRLANDILDAETDDDRLLDEITSISVRLTKRASDSDFRMDATQAYGAIVNDRLADLNPRSCGGYLSLADFTQRRLLPALRTCDAHKRRAAQLDARAQQFAALLRTRIDMRIERQNAMVLESMERNSARQLRLQQLVEGLSVVALSYYTISLLAHVLEGAEHVFGIDPGMAIALATPLVVALVWLTMRQAKARLHLA